MEDKNVCKLIRLSTKRVCPFVDVIRNPNSKRVLGKEIHCKNEGCCLVFVFSDKVKDGSTIGIAELPPSCPIRKLEHHPDGVLYLDKAQVYE